MAANKTRILFDANILADSIVKHIARAGIYSTAYNIFRLMARREDIELVLCAGYPNRLRRYLKRYFPDEGRFRVVGASGEAGEVDAFFSPGTMLDEWVRDRYPGISCYNVLYDIIPVLHPEYFPHSQSPGMLYMLDNFAANDHYFVISESSRNDVVRMGNGVDPGMMTVVPLGANERFRKNTDPAALAALRRKYDIPGDKRYMLSLCTREPRKNLINTVRAFIEFVDKRRVDDLVYVLAGGIWDIFRDKLRHIDGYDRHADKILEIGYVDDDDLAPLYSNALWFVYTPHYEGFGLPPLEAMQCGCPVITSDNSSLPEVVGDAGLAVDSHDVAQHVQAYARYYDSPALRAENAAKGLERAKRFSWQRCCDIICDRILADVERKRARPRVSVVVAANAAGDPWSPADVARCLDSASRQDYPDLRLRVVDCGADASLSAALSAYAGANAVALQSAAGADAAGAFNAALADLDGEYAAFLTPAARYDRDDFVTVSVMKAEEFAADLTYADALASGSRGRRIWRGDARELPFGEHFSCCSTLVKTSLLREAGGFSIRFGDAARDEFVMRLARDGGRLTHVPTVRIALDTGGERPERNAADFAAAFHHVFGERLGLSRADAEDLYDGGCLRKYSADRVAALAAKLPFNAGGGALLEKLVATRSFFRLAEDERLRWLMNSGHRLFGLIPLSVRHSGNAVRSATTYSLGGIPLIRTTRREGARFSCYLFGFLPVFRSKYKS